MLRIRPLAVAATLGLTATLLATAPATAPATAAPPHFETISEVSSEHVEDFCGIEGFAVDRTVMFESRLKIRTARSGIQYFLEHITTEETVTGVASGRSVHIHTAFLSKDLKIVDNGDGTLTITQLLTGPSTMYDADGKAIARDPGQVRLLLHIDTNGTPGDPEDDFDVSPPELIKGSTGRSDDYCAVMFDEIG